MARYRRVARKAPVVVATPKVEWSESARKDDLVAAAEAAGLDTSGTKADLVARLRGEA